MKPKSKARQTRPATCKERVLDACAQLALLSPEPVALQKHIAESASQIFQAAVAGLLVREGERHLPAAVASGSENGAGNKALLSHAESFATQAIEQKRQLN